MLKMVYFKRLHVTITYFEHQKHWKNADSRITDHFLYENFMISDQVIYVEFNLVKFI